MRYKLTLRSVNTIFGGVLKNMLAIEVNKKSMLSSLIL